MAGLQKKNQRLRMEVYELAHELAAEKRELDEQIELVTQLSPRGGRTQKSSFTASKRENELKQLQTEVIQLRRAVGEHESLHMVADSLIRANQGKNERGTNGVGRERESERCSWNRERGRETYGARREREMK
jgi:hypothetical protein